MPKYTSAFNFSDSNSKPKKPKKEEKDYYKILGVSKYANPQQIKQAYKKKAKKLHPDKHPYDQETYKSLFQEVGEAYEILKDQKKREIYDKFGIRGVKNEGFFIPSTQDELNDLFKMAFGEDDETVKYAYLDKPQCSSIKLSQKVTLVDAYNGDKYISIEYDKMTKCSKCKNGKVTFHKECYYCEGQGSISVRGFSQMTWVECSYCGGKKTNVCGRCKGKKRIPRAVYGEYSCNFCNGTGKGDKICNECDENGLQAQTVYFRKANYRCEVCNGTGRKADSKICDDCDGKYYKPVFTKKTIQVPLGIRDREQQILHREGNEGKNKENGDVIITYVITKHDKYTRKGDDLFTQVDINFLEGICGFSFILDHISGQKYTIKSDPINIKSNTIQQNDIKCIKGLGMPYKTSNITQFGDLYVQFKLHNIPQNLLNEKQWSMFNKLKSSIYPNKNINISKNQKEFIVAEINNDKKSQIFEFIEKENIHNENNTNNKNKQQGPECRQM